MPKLHWTTNFNFVLFPKNFCCSSEFGNVPHLWLAYWLLLFFVGLAPLVPLPGWTEFWIRLPVLLEAVQVFFHHCLHAWCTALAAYISADTVSYHCNGFPLCPLLCPLLPLRPLLPGVGFGSTLSAAFCCEGWTFGLSSPFKYYAA